MRIRIDDDFDNDLDAQYKSVDNDTIVGNGALSKENIPIIDVKSEDIKEELVDGEMENGSIRQKEITEYNLDNGIWKAVKQQSKHIMGSKTHLDKMVV